MSPAYGAHRRLPARVLIVDDNEVLVENVAELLEELGVDSVPLTDPQAAIDAAREGFDLALVDIGLPRVSGVELLSRLKELRQDAEVVLMTGHGTLESAIEAVHHGAFAYLLKPFDPEALLMLAERALAQVALRRERVSLAKALGESEALYRGVVENVDAFIVGIGTSGAVVFCNEYALKTYGGDAGIYGEQFVEVCTKDRAHVGVALRAALAGEVSREAQADLQTRDGRRRIVRWRFSPVEPGHSDRIGVIAIGIDVTEQIELRKRSANVEALAAIGVLTAGLAHEIRNPLNAASLQLQLLSRRAQKLEDQELRGRLLEPVELVRNELGRLTQLLNDFLGLARPQELESERFPIETLIAEVVALEKPLCAADGMELVCECHGAPEASADRGRVKQVLVNLVQNAREAMLEQRRGRITLSARTSGDWVEVQVRDSGPGLRGDGDFFEPFYTTKPAGTGLGLAIVHRIVRMHGGSISLTNAPGGGAVATFTIPRPT